VVESVTLMLVTGSGTFVVTFVSLYVPAFGVVTAEKF
jgi:hypothetical protein